MRNLRRPSILFLLLGLLAPGLALHGCNESDGQIFQAGMNAVAVSPPDGATDVPVSAVVRVTFDQDLNPATLTTSNFAVTGPGGQIPGLFAYEIGTRTASFVPDADLPASTQIRISLTLGLSGVSGDRVTPRAIDFTTGNASDSTPPTFAGATTAEGRNAAVLVEWASPAGDDVDAPGSISYRIYRATTSGGQDFAQPVALAGPGSTMLIDTGLSPMTAYFYVVRAVDTSGNEDANVVEVTATTN